MEQNIEKFKLTSSKKCREVLANNPTYKLYWRSGYAFRGACEREVDRNADDFTQQMERKYNWAAGIDIEVDHNKKEIHLNGFSTNDLWC